jgi:hypothetical protein
MCMSCNEKQLSKDLHNENDSAIVNSNDTNFSKQLIIPDTIPSFILFWKEFRKAIINFDTLDIMQRSNLPLKCRGPLDNDPIIKLSENKFNMVFSLFLKQWNGQDLNEETELEFIKRTGVPTDLINAGIARVGNMVFAIKRKEWKLDFLYLNEETIELLAK